MSFGGTIKLTGESEYKKALEGIRQELKEVGAQMKLTAAQYKHGSDAMESLEAKSKLLYDTLKLQEKKISTLKDRQKELTEIYAKSAKEHENLIAKYESEVGKLKDIEKTLGKTSEDYKKQKEVVEELAVNLKKSTDVQDKNEKSMSNMRTELTKAETAYYKTKNAISDLDGEMKTAADETKKMSSAYGKLKDTITDQEGKLRKLKTEYANVVLSQGENSNSAKKLGREIFNLSSELKSNKDKMKDAEMQADKLDKSLNKVDKTAGDAAKGGFTVLKGAMANLISKGIGKLVDAVKGQFGNAIWRVDTITSFEKTMTNLGYSAEETAESIEKLKAAAKGMPTTLPSLAETQGQFAALIGDMSEATDLTTALSYAILAGSKDMDTYNRALDQWYQIIANGKPNLTSWRIINKAMPAQLNQIAESVLGAGSKSQDLFEEWKEGRVTTGQITKSLINLSKRGGGGLESFEKQARDSSAGIKTSMDNINNAISIGISDLIETIGAEKVVSMLEGIRGAVAETFKLLGEAMKFIIDNKEGVVTAITAIGAAIAAYSTYTTALSLMANPIGLVVAAVAGLVAGFVALWNTSEDFRNFWIGLWDNIKAVCEPVISGLAKWFSEAWGKIKEIWGPVSEFFSNLFSHIGDTAVPIIQSIGDAFSKAWEFIKLVWDAAAPYFSVVWDSIKIVFSVVKDVLVGYFSAAWAGIKGVWDIAVLYFKTIWESIKAVFSVVRTYFEGAFRTAWEAIKGVWNVATGFFKAIWDSIAKIFSVVRNVLSGNWRDAWEGIKSIVSTWASFFKMVWDNIKNVFGSAASWFGDTFSAAWEAIKKAFSGWRNFFEGLLDIIKNTFSSIGKTIMDSIGGVFKSAMGLLNKIPGVNIGGANVPQMASGGVLENGARTIIAGEDGAEAIVPLEKNTKWIRRVAGELQNYNNLETSWSGSNDLSFKEMVKAFKTALGEMQIELDDEPMGKFVEKTVTEAIYSTKGVMI